MSAKEAILNVAGGVPSELRFGQDFDRAINAVETSPEPLELYALCIYKTTDGEGVGTTTLEVIDEDRFRQLKSFWKEGALLRLSILALPSPVE